MWINFFKMNLFKAALTPELPALEATATGMANTATSANSRDTDKKNARCESIQPCRNTQGRYYWPKVYFMEENEAKAVNAIDEEEVRPTKGESPFNIVGLATKTRAAALTPQFPGFQ
jgi:hypothetical protein